MDVQVISSTSDMINVMYVAARTCYSSKSPIGMWNEINEDNTSYFVEGTFEDQIKEQQEKHYKLVKKVLDSGHHSIAEHVYFTFAIEGISRACSHQLVRHRHCTFSQQSQRYVEIKEDLKYLQQLYQQTKSKDDTKRSEAIQTLCKIVDKYFVKDNDKIGAIKYFFCLMDYLMAIQDGCKPEDARQLLPNATKTNIVVSTNLRNLIHICNLRLCTRAQKEINSVFKLIVQRILERCNTPQEQELLKTLLVKQCDMLGYCPEIQCCGIHKPLSVILNKE